MSRTLIFDTETTGLLAPKLAPLVDQPSIIEFYGCIINENDEIIEELEFLCTPGFPVSDLITKITTITNDQLKDEKPFSEYEEAVRNFIGGVDEVVAHNLKFDFGMVDNELKRCGTDQLLKWPTMICTVEKTYCIKGRRMKLTDLHHHLFSAPFDGAHRAKVDVQALTRCFVKLRKDGFI